MQEKQVTESIRSLHDLLESTCSVLLRMCEPLKSLEKTLEANYKTELVQ